MGIGELRAEKLWGWGCCNTRAPASPASVRRGRMFASHTIRSRADGMHMLKHLVRVCVFTLCASGWKGRRFVLCSGGGCRAVFLSPRCFSGFSMFVGPPLWVLLPPPPKKLENPFLAVFGVTQATFDQSRRPFSPPTFRHPQISSFLEEGASDSQNNLKIETLVQSQKHHPTNLTHMAGVPQRAGHCSKPLPTRGSDSGACSTPDLQPVLSKFPPRGVECQAIAVKCVLIMRLCTDKL